ncbi:hypothetical protein BD410DRAFT_551552 [Rickenella mellea]|uniref:Uncharacterized protein n=1 Tax=Rickenella mellea TaxID=50990 RepID=A0A4Y7PRE8_9AGAM|nr:hypothetical protein BD410DRAFT_551552 [Rickenella mellea]
MMVGLYYGWKIKNEKNRFLVTELVKKLESAREENPRRYDKSTCGSGTGRIRIAQMDLFTATKGFRDTASVDPHDGFPGDLPDFLRPMLRVLAFPAVLIAIVFGNTSLISVFNFLYSTRWWIFQASSSRMWMWGWVDGQRNDKLGETIAHRAYDSRVIWRGLRRSSHSHAVSHPRDDTLPTVPACELDLSRTFSRNEVPSSTMEPRFGRSDLCPQTVASASIRLRALMGFGQDGVEEPS